MNEQERYRTFNSAFLVNIVYIQVAKAIDMNVARELRHAAVH